MLRQLWILATSVCLACASIPARAESPGVVTDIAPVHALAAQVMQGIGAPNLLVSQGASPHHLSLRPSQATALQEAALVIWVGPDLTPWMDGAIDELAGDAMVLHLLDLPETHRLPLRESDAFDHASHDHGHEDEHDHHGAVDPHAWLNPENGKAWLGAIADALSDLNPENAPTYRKNAEEGQARIDVLTGEIETRLAPMSTLKFIVLHDAYGYFEDRFDLAATGAVSLGDAADPGPAHIAELRQRITDAEVTCALAEPQNPTKLLETVLEGQDVRVVQADPTGSTLPLGPDLYGNMLRGLADAFSNCQ